MMPAKWFHLAIFLVNKMKAILLFCDMMRENLQPCSKDEISWTTQI